MKVIEKALFFLFSSLAASMSVAAMVKDYNAMEEEFKKIRKGKKV